MRSDAPSACLGVAALGASGSKRQNSPCPPLLFLAEDNNRRPPNYVQNVGSTTFHLGNSGIPRQSAMRHNADGGKEALLFGERSGGHLLIPEGPRLITTPVP